jgi:hypothetical protein
MSKSAAHYSSAILVLVMPGSSVHHISGLRLHVIQFLFQGLGLHCPVFVISFTDGEDNPADSVNVEFLFWTKAKQCDECPQKSLFCSCG